jgi:hypothetical protein
MNPLFINQAETYTLQKCPQRELLKHAVDLEWPAPVGIQFAQLFGPPQEPTGYKG